MGRVCWAAWRKVMTCCFRRAKKSAAHTARRKRDPWKFVSDAEQKRTAARIAAPRTGNGTRIRASHGQNIGIEISTELRSSKILHRLRMRTRRAVLLPTSSSPTTLNEGQPIERGAIQVSIPWTSKLSPSSRVRTTAASNTPSRLRPVSRGSTVLK